MNAKDMIEQAVGCLTEAQLLAVEAAGKAEVDPAKTDQKVQRLAFVADAWLRAAELRAHLEADDPGPVEFKNHFEVTHDDFVGDRNP